MGSAQGLIDVARSYLGTTEDDPRFFELIDYYNEHTGGYDMSYYDEWCACFASVCSLKSGNADATGTNVNCAEFRRIWREKGIYRERWETPAAGWLIDYDWQQDGIPDHIGIVVDCDGETIHVIEGNTDGEMCAEHWIPVGSWSISCFAAPEYDESEDDMALTDNDIARIRDAILGYKNPNMDILQNKEGADGRGVDAWQLWWNASEQLTRTDNAEHNTPKGHDMFGRVNMLQEDSAEIKELLKQLVAKL